MSILLCAAGAIHEIPDFNSCPSGNSFVHTNSLYFYSPDYLVKNELCLSAHELMINHHELHLRCIKKESPKGLFFYFL